MAAATTEMWPSVSRTMGAWRVGRGSQTQLPSSTRSQEQPGTKSTSSNANMVGLGSVRVGRLRAKSKQGELPGFFRNVPSTSNLMSRMSTRNSSITTNGFSTMPTASSTFSNSILRQLHSVPTQQRYMSTTRQLRFQKPAFINGQKRTLFSNGTSRNVLAQLEETANKNPNSPSSQSNFYQALLRANMPAIIVERYQSNQFANNGAIDGIYQRALAMSNQGGVATQFGANNASNLTPGQIQAVTQAVAAQHKGGNVAVSTGMGSGASNAPLHVVVEETIGSTIFKWVKLILYFSLFTYLSLAIVTMIVDAFQTFKKVGGNKTDMEAKAEQQTVKFSDVHGCDEAKEELQEIVEFLKNPDKFSSLGGKLPKGVLLVGPPGTGKTLIARAIAGEAGVPFFFMSGSEFDEMYVGVGAKRVRELFAAAKGKSPAIVFIDELDAVGGKRNSRDPSYHRQTLNQLLTELDGFEQNSGVIIVGATNFPETLDAALTRPGRFDRNIVIGLPDVRGRASILLHHMKKIVAGPDVNVDILAAGMPGFSGAELENVINQAAVHASKGKAKSVGMLDFEWAKDKVMMGAEKRSMVITEKEKMCTAYHEAGHALVLMFTPNTNPLHKITIMPRGMSLGMTMHLPEMDKYSMGMHEYQAQIDVCLGGKVAEEIQYGADNVTSGVSSVSHFSPTSSSSYSMIRTNYFPRTSNKQPKSPMQWLPCSVCPQLLGTSISHPTTIDSPLTPRPSSSKKSDASSKKAESEPQNSYTANERNLTC